MTDDQLESVSRLQQRIEALEASFATAQSRSARPRLLGRPAFGWLVPALAVAGWAMAQPKLAPKEELIRKAPDGTIEVSAPFRVVGAGGRVILGVAADPDPSAATSIFYKNGGNVRVQSGEGDPMAGIGVNPAGNGRLYIQDRLGTLRAVVDTSVFVNSESGKQVAALGLIDGKGVVGVWGAGRSGERVIAMTEGSTGAGTLTVYDKAHSTIAVLASAVDGSGEVQLFGKGRSEAATWLGVNQRGAGHVSLTDGGGKAKVYLTGSDDDGRGLISVAAAKDGLAIASLTTNGAGAGDLILRNADGGMGMEAVGAPASNAGRGGTVAVFNKDQDIVASMGTLDDGRGLIAIQEKGKPLVNLGRGDEGAGQVIVMNAAGKFVVHAKGATEGGGGGIVVLNESEDPVAGIGTSSQGKGNVTVFDTDHTAAELTAGANGTGELSLRNAQGKLAVQASVAPEGGGGVTVFSASEEPVASVGTSDKGKGVFTIFENDHAVAELMANTTGAGYLYLTDAQGKISLDAKGDTGSLTTFSKGQIVATLGTTDGTADQGKARIAIFGKAGAIAELAESSSGGGLVLVRNAKNAVVAGLSGGVNDAGAVMVKNSSGATVSEMSVTTDGRGQVAVYDAGGGPPVAVMARSPETKGGIVQVSNGKLSVAHLMASSRGGGYLQINSASGSTVIEAGANDAGVGVVRAGPNFTCEPKGGYAGMRVPDCIVGTPPK